MRVLGSRNALKAVTSKIQRHEVRYAAAPQHSSWPFHSSPPVPPDCLRISPTRVIAHPPAHRSTRPLSIPAPSPTHPAPLSSGTHSRPARSHSTHRPDAPAPPLPQFPRLHSYVSVLRLARASASCQSILTYSSRVQPAPHRTRNV